MINKSNQETFVILGTNKADNIQLVLWCWFKELKIATFTPGIPKYIKTVFNRLFYARRYLERCSRELKSELAQFKGLRYQMNDECIRLTKKFYEEKITNSNFLVSFYGRYFKTNKFEAFIKKEINYQIFELLRALHLIRCNEFDNAPIVISRHPVSEYVVHYMQETYHAKYNIQYVSSLLNPFLIIVYGCWLLVQFVKRGFVFNQPLEKFKISKEACWGFHREILRDDVFIDGAHFKASDMLLLEFNPFDAQRFNSYKKAKELNFRTASLVDLKINVKKNFWDFLYFYCVAPLRGFVFSIFYRQMYLFYYTVMFHMCCFPIEVLMNSFQIKSHISSSDHGDIANTMILNKYGTKNVLFHWSELTMFKDNFWAFIAHNIYYIWGHIHFDYNPDTTYIDQKINTGCIFKEIYQKALAGKGELMDRIQKLDRNKKSVVFFDTSFGSLAFYTNAGYLAYMRLIYNFCTVHPMVNVLLKMKMSLNEVEQNFNNEEDLKSFLNIMNQLNECPNFIYLDPDIWGFEQAIAISDVCVNMGMNTPATIALICEKDALYFENSGNYEHPFSKKYMNTIVFEEQNALFAQIDQILNGKFSCSSVIPDEEIRAYDAFTDDQGLNRLTQYLYDLTSGGASLHTIKRRETVSVET